MQNRLPALLLLLVALALPAAADAPNVGHGVILGEPSGGTVKWWVDRDEAWQFAAGVSPLREPSFQVQGDYVLHIYEIGRAIGLTQTPVYTGLGMRINGPEDDDWEAGIRFPVGLCVFLDQDNLEFFVEAVPVLDLVPGFGGDINFGVGLRFYP